MPFYYTISYCCIKIIIVNTNTKSQNTIWNINKDVMFLDFKEIT